MKLHFKAVGAAARRHMRVGRGDVESILPKATAAVTVPKLKHLRTSDVLDLQTIFTDKQRAMVSGYLKRKEPRMQETLKRLRSEDPFAEEALKVKELFEKQQTANVDDRKLVVDAMKGEQGGYWKRPRASYFTEPSWFEFTIEADHCKARLIVVDDLAELAPHATNGKLLKHAFAAKFLGQRVATSSAVMTCVSLKNQAGMETVKFKPLWKNKKVGVCFASSLDRELWSLQLVRSHCQDVHSDSKLHHVDDANVERWEDHDSKQLVKCATIEDIHRFCENYAVVDRLNSYVKVPHRQ